MVTVKSKTPAFAAVTTKEKKVGPCWVAVTGVGRTAPAELVAPKETAKVAQLMGISLTTVKVVSLATTLPVAGEIVKLGTAQQAMPMSAKVRTKEKNEDIPGVVKQA